MKKAEDAVESVMAVLRRAEAAPGLEERVRDGVRRRIAEREDAGGWAGRHVFGWRWAAVGCIGMATLLGVAVSGSWFERHSVKPPAVTFDRQAAPVAMGAGSAGVDRGVQLGEGVRQRLKPHTRRLARATAEAVPPNKALAFDSHASAVAGAVSFPAPPLPLTAQERLLLRIANHSGPEEVAMLDPVARAMWDVEETAVFLDFFGRPVSVEQTNQKINEGESR